MTSELTRLAFRFVALALICTETVSVTGCGKKAAAPPDEALVGKLAGPWYRLEAGQLDEVIYGEPMISKGLYGPEGTTVFPVKLRFHTPPAYNGEGVAYFWKDPFGEWQFKAQNSTER